MNNIDNFLELMIEKINLSTIDNRIISANKINKKSRFSLLSDKIVLLSPNHKALKEEKCMRTLKSSERLAFRNYNNKANAKAIIYFHIDTLADLLMISSKDNIETLSEHLQFIARIINISEKMKAYSNNNNLQILTLSNINYKKSRPEITFSYYAPSIEVAVPVTESQFTTLMTIGCYHIKH